MRKKEIEKEEKRRKEIFQQIIKSRNRNHSFQYMINFLGKGPKYGLRKLHIKNNNDQIIKTLSNREEIEREIIGFI